MEEIHMNNVKKIAILLLVVAVMTGFTQAASHHHSGPDATLRMSGGGSTLESVSAGGQERSAYRGKTIRSR